jgi:uncharacterized protein (DUF1697 family)
VLRLRHHGRVPTHVALLRGINVGTAKKVDMAALREVCTALGHTDVATYIRSGNVVLTSDRSDQAAIAAELEGAIADRLGVRCAVVVLDRADYAAAVANNPYPEQAAADPKKVHAVFHATPPGEAERAAIAGAEQRARDKGSRDEVTVVGRVAYLHLPDGMGRSELAAQLAKLPRGADGGGTARNWATVRKLQEMLGSD